MRDGGRGAANLWRRKQKRGQIARVSAATGGSAASLDRAVDDFHRVACAPARRRGVREQTLGAVFVADADLVLHGLLRVLLDRVSGKAAAQSAKDGRNVLASATAHLVAEHPADYRAADGPAARPGTGFLDL